MFEHLRTRDKELFEQLALVCEELVQSTHLLEQLLGGGREDERRFVRAIREIDRAAHDRALAIDAQAFKAFVMRVDRMDVHELATALAAAVEGVEEAATQIEALHASGAPDELRALAGVLGRAALVLAGAVPHVGRSSERIPELVASLRALEDEGEAHFYRGVEQLFAGPPDAVEVLRWKDVYEKISEALQCCVHVGAELERVNDHAT